MALGDTIDSVLLHPHSRDREKGHEVTKGKIFQISPETLSPNNDHTFASHVLGSTSHVFST